MAVSDRPPQQHHKRILEPRQCRLDFGVLKRAAKPVAAGGGRAHDAHLPGFGHGIDQVRLLQQPRLQSACGLPRRRRGARCPPARYGRNNNEHDRDLLADFREC